MNLDIIFFFSILLYGYHKMQHSLSLNWSLFYFQLFVNVLILKLYLQLSYPCTPCVRKGWVVRQVMKLILFTGVMGFIVEQVGII